MVRYGDVGTHYENLMKRIEVLSKRAEDAQRQGDTHLAEELCEEADTLLTAAIILLQTPVAEVVAQ